MRAVLRFLEDAKQINSLHQFGSNCDSGLSVSLSPECFIPLWYELLGKGRVQAGMKIGAEAYSVEFKHWQGRELTTQRILWETLLWSHNYTKYPEKLISMF